MIREIENVLSWLRDKFPPHPPPPLPSLSYEKGYQPKPKAEADNRYLGLNNMYHIKQIDSMLPCVCSVIDHRRRQNVVRTSVTHSAIASCVTFLFLPHMHFDDICDLLLNRRTATWNLLVNFIIYWTKKPWSNAFASSLTTCSTKHENLT